MAKDGKEKVFWSKEEDKECKVDLRAHLTIQLIKPKLVFLSLAEEKRK
jgi:hypothetical protein